MARTTTPAPVSAPTGAVVLPDASEWSTFDVKPVKHTQTEPHGRIIGIDYEQWAVAWEDARQKPERLAARAIALEAKGFRELTGQTLVAHGVDSAIRVWVMPRNLYEQRRSRRDQSLVDKVKMGLYPESALSEGQTRAMRK